MSSRFRLTLRRCLAQHRRRLLATQSDMPAPIKSPQTLYDKVYESHVVRSGEGDTLLYCDRHLVHEVTSPQAFETLRQSGRRVRRPELTLATVDHNVPTISREGMKHDVYLADAGSRAQVAQMMENVREFNIAFFGLDDKRQGIVHIIGPEQGFTLPGTVVVCGDSHTSTHGAFGALAFGMGTSEVSHVLATQTIPQNKAKNMRINVEGTLLPGVTAKDVILHIIGLIGTVGGTGHVIEYSGSTIRELSMEARMSICNMSIEAGAKAGMVEPDDKTYEYLKGRPLCPQGDDWDEAVRHWKQTLKSDQGARYDVDVQVKASDISPTTTWGTSPQDVLPITGRVPTLDEAKTEVEREDTRRSLEYMGLQGGERMEDIEIDKAFIGSCTNARIEDLRQAAEIVLAAERTMGLTHVPDRVQAMVVPGSGLVKAQAEAEGLDIIFKRAGFEWREAGCSMCLGMNPDALLPGERCASTSNRNFEGRQGAGGRTHLMSPAMVAAAALTGRLTDVRKLLGVDPNPHAPGFKTTSHLDYLTSTVLSDPHPHTTEAGLTTLPPSAKQQAAIAAGLPKFTVWSGVAVPFTDSNIDTDKVIPKQFLKTLTRTGLGKSLFFPLRFDPKTGDEVEDFVLNQEPWRHAKVLVCKGGNFACGSAREHAAWAFADFGIRCFIAPTIGEIFTNNCYKNGMLCIELPQDQVDMLHADASAGKDLTIDLERQLILRDGQPSDGPASIAFDIDPFRKHCLIEGLDDIALTMQYDDLIAEYERRRVIEWPWLREKGEARRIEPVAVGAPAAKTKRMDW